MLCFPNPDILEYVLEKIDLILIMTVNPGFGGQKFMPNQLSKIQKIHNLVGKQNIMIAVDGGINQDTANLCKHQGANLLISGSYIFNGNYKENILALHDKIHNLHEHGKLLPVYFGSEKNKFNGYLQKADVYALGLAIFIMLYVYSGVDVRANANLYDLLIHMIAMDPDKRYNAVQCLSHPFLQSIKKN